MKNFNKKEKYRSIFFVCLTAIVVVAFFLRFYDLEARPVHHDEGVNGWFIQKLLDKGDYEYSPEHYHGPTLFYIGQFSSTIFQKLWPAKGHSPLSLRIVTALFGFLLCLTPLLVRRYIGKAGVLASMSILAVSPGSVFYSRYAIHEMLLVFFVTIAALCLFLYLHEGKIYYLITFALSLAYAAATKETVIISVAAMGFGVLVTLLFTQKTEEGLWRKKGIWGFLKSRFAIQYLFMIIILFFIGLFTWFKKREVLDFFISYSFYLNLGTENAGHTKSWSYFLRFLGKTEWFLLMGGIGGAVIAICRRRAFDLFCLAWAFTMISAHSVVGYKTPWLIINLTTPLAFLFGSFFYEIGKTIKGKPNQCLVVAIFSLLALFTLQTSFNYNLRIFQEPQNPYFYVHTVENAHDLEKRIKGILEEKPDLKLAWVDTVVWPYPFLLYGYNQVVWWSRLVEKKDLDVPLIVANTKQQDELMPRLSRDYIQEKYSLRPGEDLHLYIEKGLLNN
ncbi:MAG: TIGR03663 family protein [Deltaproteobacteria bacterium]|nr:TIGR03663 family protein [Deltaproteobacteria bacterium]